jgi:cell filamentation protein
LTIDPYVYPGTTVLRNLFDIRDADDLDIIERRLTLTRAEEGCPTGNFDLSHLRAIHKHLFQDIYAWAGEIRTVEISKGGNQFQLSPYIETGMANVHNRLVKARFLEGLQPDAFAQAAGTIIGDINYVHPFREGNGRTQLQYLEQLCDRAGHILDVRDIDGEAWIEASQRAHDGDYRPMADEIARVIDLRSREVYSRDTDRLAEDLRRIMHDRDNDHDRE